MVSQNKNARKTAIKAAIVAQIEWSTTAPYQTKEFIRRESS